MSLYIHYWFANYAERNAVDLNENLYNTFNAAKNKSLYFGKSGLLNQEFANRKSSILGGNISQEMEELIEFLSDPNSELAKMRHDTYSSNLVGGWRPVQTTNSFTNPEEVATNVSIFMSELKSKIDEMTKKLNLDLDTFKNQIIQEYATKRGVKVGSKNFSRKVIQDFITHDGIKRLHLTTSPGTESATLDSCIRSIILLASALPDFGEEGSSQLGSMRYSTSTKSGISGSGSATLGIIAGKLSGLWNNVVGKGGEIAWKKAEEEGLKAIQQEDEKIKKNIPKRVKGRNLSFDVSVTGENLVESTDNSEIKSVSKPDVVVTVQNGKIVIQYGVSVKQYSFNSKTNTSSVSIVSGTSFLQALQRYAPAGKDFGYLMNLAAGHPGQGGSKQSAKEYTIAALNNAWQNLVDSVVIMNFLDFLAGRANESPATLYIVSNGTILSIESLLEEAFNNPFSSRVYERTKANNGRGTKSLTRASLMKLNEWKWANPDNRNRIVDRNTEQGKIRSENAYKAIYTRLAQQKLDVSLNMLLT